MHSSVRAHYAPLRVAITASPPDVKLSVVEKCVNVSVRA